MSSVEQSLASIPTMYEMSSREQLQDRRGRGHRDDDEEENGSLTPKMIATHSQNLPSLPPLPSSFGTHSRNIQQSEQKGKVMAREYRSSLSDENHFEVDVSPDSPSYGPPSPSSQVSHIQQQTPDSYHEKKPRPSEQGRKKYRHRKRGYSETTRRPEKIPMMTENEHANIQKSRDDFAILPSRKERDNFFHDSDVENERYKGHTTPKQTRKYKRDRWDGEATDQKMQKTKQTPSSATKNRRDRINSGTDQWSADPEEASESRRYGYPGSQANWSTGEEEEESSESVGGSDSEGDVHGNVTSPKKTSSPVQQPIPPTSHNTPKGKQSRPASAQNKRVNPVNDMTSPRMKHQSRSPSPKPKSQRNKSIDETKSRKRSDPFPTPGYDNTYESEPVINASEAVKGSERRKKKGQKSSKNSQIPEQDDKHLTNRKESSPPLAGTSLVPTLPPILPTSTSSNMIRQTSGVNIINSSPNPIAAASSFLVQPQHQTHQSPAIAELIQPVIPATTLPNPPELLPMVPGSILANVGGTTPAIPPIMNQTNEKERLAALHLSGLLETTECTRLQAVAAMTSKMMNGVMAVVSIVDVDKVQWKACYNPISNFSLPFEEPRYESYCSWVVQEQTDRGITILDAKSDPRCTHMRVKPGMEFYAGVPILSIDRKKIGALSIRGPPRTQFSVIEMNILHEMALWASGELDTLFKQREAQIVSAYLQAQMQLWRLVDKIKTDESIEELTQPILDMGLNIVRKAIKASYVILLVMVTEQRGPGFKSVVRSISTNANAPISLNLGDECFYELCLQSLKKTTSLPVVLDPLSTGPITRDVDRFLSKSVLRCSSELVWAYGRPVGVIACFFEGSYRILQQNELNFVSQCVSPISAIVEKLDSSDAYFQFGTSLGLAPFVLVIEPVIPHVKGSASVYEGDSELNLKVSDSASGKVSDVAQIILKPISGIPKGLMQAQAIAKVQASQKQESASAIPSIESASSAAAAAIAAITAANDRITMSEPTTKQIIENITPLETIEIVNDFQSMVDVLADRHQIKRPKNYGNILLLIGNSGPESGSPEDAANLAHELLFTLDVYNQKTHRNIKAKIGIHLDFIPTSLEKEGPALRDIWASITAVAFQLESVSDSVLVSDVFYHQTKNTCTYESTVPVYVKGQGSSMAYKLIGVSKVPISLIDPADPMFANPRQNNPINNASSLFLQKLPPIPAIKPVPENEEAIASLQTPFPQDSNTSAGVPPQTISPNQNVSKNALAMAPDQGSKDISIPNHRLIESGDDSLSSKKKKSRACLIM